LQTEVDRGLAIDARNPEVGKNSREWDGAKRSRGNAAGNFLAATFVKTFPKFDRARAR
jgi:hypothetical protein